MVAKKWDSKRFLAYIIDEAGSDAQSREITPKKLQDAASRCPAPAKATST